MYNSEIDPTFYDNHDFGEDFYEAEKNGSLLVIREGEDLIETIRRHRESLGTASVAGSEQQLVR